MIIMLIVVKVYREDPTIKLLEVFEIIVNRLEQFFAIISFCLDCNDPDPDPVKIITIMIVKLIKIITIAILLIDDIKMTFAKK